MIGRTKAASVQILMGIVVTGLVLIIIDNVSVPGHGRLSRAINNAGHIPLFGFVALAMLAIIRSAWSKSQNHLLACYGLAFVAAGSLGAGTELMQYFGPRDADLWDLLRDLVGAFSFLAIFATYDRHQTKLPGMDSAKVRTALRWTGISLLTLGFSSVMLWSAAFFYRNTQMPVICNFDSYLHTRFVRLQNATLEPVSEIDGLGEGAVLTLEMGKYPGLSLEDVYPDWTGYDSLIIEINSLSDSIIMVSLRIDDLHHDGAYEDRYTGRFELTPGANRIAISLFDVKHGPNQRLQDMQQIASMWIYGDTTSSGTKLLMQRISLK